ncbi:MAG: hypothetical protein WC554_14460 [Clostridia bacterium]
MDRKDHASTSMKELRIRSGRVESDNKFVTFVYELLRDKVPAADIEECVLNSTGPGTDNFQFTNGYLAEYAKDVVKRLNS